MIREGTYKCLASRGGWFCRRFQHWGIERRGYECLYFRRVVSYVDLIKLFTLILEKIVVLHVAA